MFDIKLAARIEEDFIDTRERLGNRAGKLFSVLHGAGEDEILCLKYLYNFLPLSDAATYDGAFFLENVREALAARRQFSWGESVPDLLFFNYVLPVRVNNEDLTDHRTLFREELEGRIAGLSLPDAVLAVNLWCFEKASYQSTDSRTVSPLTIIRRAVGRCGEESTLAVSALRSVGIPARQCYTPRWAHSDDNHAWVEAWVEGNWHYFGACEPEAALDRAWFSAPAKRAMLVESRLFSNLLSDEDVIVQNNCMTVINLTDRYAPTAELTIAVFEDGRPLANVKIEIAVVNYASIAPLTELETDDDGYVRLKCGRGDLMIRAMRSYATVEKKVSLLDGDHSLRIDFQKEPDAAKAAEQSFNMRAPLAVAAEYEAVQQDKLRQVREEMALAERKRAVYISSFYPSVDPYTIGDPSGVVRKNVILAASLGNYDEILTFLNESESDVAPEEKYAFLEVLNDKDLADVTAELLLHHLTLASTYRGLYEPGIYLNYILNPRIGIEMIRPWRELTKRLTKREQLDFKNNPALIESYVKEQVRVDGRFDYASLIADPNGLLDLGRGSIPSCRYLVVAIARSLGIPARINRVNYNLEFYQDSDWVGTLNVAKLTLTTSDSVYPPEYGADYSLAMRTDTGTYVVLGLYHLTFEERTEIEVDLEAGSYELLQSNRVASGDQVCNLTHFDLAAGECKTFTIEAPRDETMEADLMPFHPLALQDGLYDASEKMRLLAVLSPGSEPTEHFLSECLMAESSLGTFADRVSFVLSHTRPSESSKLDEVMAVLPSIQVREIADSVNHEGYVGRSYDLYTLHNRDLPLLVLTNSEGRVALALSGYQVGSVALILRRFAYEFEARLRDASEMGR